MNPANENDPLVHPPRACPICTKPATMKFKPFCSARCADIDLNRWLKGAYAIPVTADDDEDGDSPDQAPRGRE
jgi:endogenous inhibitor of DNA gyrase (YacG/DUF329 family)